MSSAPQRFDHFLAAQEGVFETALAELEAGAKRTHWMWFVFPQHVALGRSATAKQYGIASLEDARAYLDHPVLGPRLDRAVSAALASGETDPERLFGAPDDLKFRSCLTLFLAARPGAERLERALARFYGGRPDEATLALLKQPPAQPGGPGA